MGSCKVTSLYISLCLNSRLGSITWPQALQSFALFCSHLARTLTAWSTSLLQGSQILGITLLTYQAPHSLLLCSRVCSWGSAQLVSTLYTHVAIQPLYVMRSMSETSDCHGHFPIMLQTSLLVIWSSSLNSLVSMFWGKKKSLAKNFLTTVTLWF